MYSQNLISELQKLYPKVKIPMYKHHEYYLDTLIKDKASYEFLPSTLSLLQQLENTLKHSDETISKYKLKNFNYIVDTFKERGYVEHLTNASKFPLTKTTQKEFNNWDINKVYLSIDLIEANWNMFKRFGMFWTKDDKDRENLNWQEYIHRVWFIHPAISNSKSFRQFVLGTLAAKALNKLGEAYIACLAEEILEGIPIKIVSLNADELIIEEDNFAGLKKIINLALSRSETPIRPTIFKIKETKSFGEFVRIKETFNLKQELIKRQLLGISGNRFFIHFKNIILNEEIHDNDLFFENDRHLAKWVLEPSETV